jgi:hypothetical protein
MVKLNGWERIEIIVCGVGGLGVGIFFYNWSVNRCLAVARQICIERENATPIEIPQREWDQQGTPLPLNPDDAFSRDRRIGECYNKQIARHPTPREAALILSALFTFFTSVSLAVGWQFVYLILFLVRWVKRGFVRPL